MPPRLEGLDDAANCGEEHRVVLEHGVVGLPPTRLAE